MIKRRYAFLTAVLAGACMVLAGCSSSSSSSATPGASSSAANSGKQLSIGFVVGLTSDPYFVTMQAGAEEEAKKLGVKLIWQGSTTTYSPSAEIPFVDSVLAQKPDAFILAATDAKAMVPSVKKAVGLGIPVLTADSTVADTSDLVTRIAGDNVNGGQLAADLLAKAIGEKGQVALLEGVPGVTPDEDRATGFINELKKYPNIQYVGKQFSNDQPSTAATQAQQLLARYPNLKGIFAIDDTTAQGTVTGLENIKKISAVKVVGYDAEPTSVAALKKGELVGLIAQQPRKEGQLAVEYAVKAAKKDTSGIPKVVNLPNITITSSNWKENQQYFYLSNQ